MTHRRRRTYAGQVKLLVPDRKCDLCRGEAWMGTLITVGEKELCFPCSWRTVESLSAVYNAPEIDALERVKHRRKNGSEGQKVAAMFSGRGLGYLDDDSAIRQVV